MTNPNYWCPKMLRETLCQQQTFAPDDLTSMVIGNLIALLDLHRPIWPDGKHADLHTPTCGCDTGDDVKDDDDEAYFESITPDEAERFGWTC